MTNYIIGNGLTGKIFAFYNREYTLIGKDRFEFKEGIASNLFFLQACIENVQFVEDVFRAYGERLVYSIKTCNIFYYDADEGVVKNNISQSDRLKIIDKKLNTWDGKHYLQFQDSIFKEKQNLSSNKDGCLEYIDINMAEFIDMLNAVIDKQIICEEVVKINCDRNTITSNLGFDYRYEKCIWTASLKSFIEKSGMQIAIPEYLDTTIVEVKNCNLVSCETAIIYFPSKKDEFGKMIKRNGKYYAEYTGVKKMDDSVIIPNSRIVKNRHLNFVKDVYFVGRFSEHNPDIRAQDIVRKAKNKYCMSEIFTNQYLLSKNYFDFSEDMDILQANVKEVSLLLTDEVMSLLNAVNWKKFQENKSVDVEKIKEEWIDVFNYWVLLGINLHLNPEEFMDAYLSKYNKNQMRFANGKSETNKLD